MSIIFVYLMMFVINDKSPVCQIVFDAPYCCQEVHVWCKNIYMTVSFYEDINDPIILKTSHFIDYNLLLFFQL